MHTAPSPPARAPGYLLPAAAHGFLCEVGDALGRMATLPYSLRHLSDRINAALHQCTAPAWSSHNRREAL
ncbi:hypothetical protein JR064_19895 [Xanthomonas sp. CFBP 8703]|uniref:Uncharacterized protein n=1 Tax=Xanthomonas bonasiae TaxID=2810351 RepID=A0ABS3B846_9XANT|nr:hypothetical protein [Xanthomonas bonasiae]MBN6104432.1 hypothetical protein [Xanthomonas bonasiae]